MSPRKHEVPDELLSSLLPNYQKPEDLIGENGLAVASTGGQADVKRLSDWQS